MRGHEEQHGYLDERQMGLCERTENKPSEQKDGASVLTPTPVVGLNTGGWRSVPRSSK